MLDERIARFVPVQNNIAVPPPAHLFPRQKKADDSKQKTTCKYTPNIPFYSVSPEAQKTVRQLHETSSFTLSSCSIYRNYSILSQW